MEIIETILEVLFGAAVDWVLGIVEMVCRFLFYPFFAVALYRLSVRENLENPILSIIPIYNMTYIVKIIKNLHVFGKKISGTALSVILIICTFLRNPFIDKIPLIGGFAEKIGLLFLFFYLLSLHRLWEMYIPKSADSFLILATLFPFTIPFLMFFIRNKQQVSSQMLLDYNSDGIIDEVVTVHSVPQNSAPGPVTEKMILKHELSPFWIKGCPLLITRQDLVTIRNTNTLFLDFMLQNLSQHTIKAIFMDILCFDYLQNPLQGVSDCKLLDLSVMANRVYSTGMNIPLPDTNTRKCKIFIKNIVFENEEIWHNEGNSALEATIAPQRISFRHELMSIMENKLRREGILYNQYLFLPSSMDDYWFCGCGQFNTSDHTYCCHCHIEKGKIFEMINEENLQQDYSLMMQEKEQQRIYNAELRVQRQQMLLVQKDKVCNQFNNGKNKIKSLWHEKLNNRQKHEDNKIDNG